LKKVFLRRKTMSSRKILSRLLVVCVLSAAIIMTGCGGPAGQGKVPEQTVLALKFNKGDTATYKSIMEIERSADFAGQITQDEQFKSSKSGTRVEMIFSQQAEGIDEKGNATIGVTIKSIKYTATSKGVPSLEFDSSNQQHQSALSKLIGQSYKIIISPTGEVIKIIGQEAIKGLVAGNGMENAAAVQLVSQNLIQKRHQIPAMVDAGGKNLTVGDKWNSIRTVSFREMGSNAFEKIYTLKAIERRGGRKEAIVEISAIPATVQKDATSPLTKLFDSSNSYTGSLVLNLSRGEVEQYSENLQAEWVVADPQATGSEPSTIKLGTKELYSLEKID
jgi:hypothetical protein